MLRRPLLSIVCVLLVASTGLGQAKRIRLKNGRVIVGEIVERTDAAIKVKGKVATVSYSLDEVEAIEDILNPKQDYKQRMAKLDKTDADAYVKLGQWAMERKLLDEAKGCFEAALKLKAGHLRAKLLLRQVKARIKAAGDGGKTTPSTSGATTVTKLPISAKDLLRKEDVQRIRLEELREGERVAIKFQDDVLRRFVDKMSGIDDFQKRGFARQFRGWPRWRQARYMLSKLDRASSMKDDILVLSDPLFMREFRSSIWRTLVPSCASTQCHGAKAGKGGLKLYNFTAASDQVDYTNFLILDSYYNKRNRRMIDRDYPDQSLLLQFGLPEAQAKFRHPKKIPSVFPSRRSPVYQRAGKWIRGLAGPPHPDYRIKKLPPFVKKPQAVLPPARKPPPKPGPATQPGPGGKKKPDVPF